MRGKANRGGIATVHFGLPFLSMTTTAVGSLSNASCSGFGTRTLWPFGDPRRCINLKPSQYMTNSPQHHIETLNITLRTLRNRYGSGFFPCRGTIEGSAGDGKGESRNWRNPYFAVNSAGLTAKVGVEFADGTRRIAVVGGILREEIIILISCLRLRLYD